MFSRAAFDRVGGFDERYWPVWFEDVDFCKKLQQAGYRVFYNPEGVAKHTGGHSVGSLGLEIRELYWYGSLLEYASKHYRSLAYRAVCLAVVSGSAFRAVRGYPRYGFKAFAVYGAVFRLACSRLFTAQRRIMSTVV